MSEPLYAVKDWDALYETHETRKRKNALQYIMVPNKWDGGGYRRLLSLPDGPSLYAAWMVILQVASRCPKRGVLADSDGEPFTAEDIHFKTLFPVDLIQKALDTLTVKKIGWLEVLNVSDLPESNQINMFRENLPQPPAPCRNSGPNGTEQNVTQQDLTTTTAREDPPRKPLSRVPSSSSGETPGQTATETPPPALVAPEVQVASWMREFASHQWGVDWGPPDAKIVRRVIAAVNGAGLDGMEACLKQLAKAKGPPGRSYAWFVGTMRNHCWHGDGDGAA